MNRFARLVAELDLTREVADQEVAIGNYLKDASPADAIWAIQLLAGKGLGRAVPARRLISWAAEVAGLPEWLMAECGEAVTDAAQAIALVLPLQDVGRGTTPALSEAVQRWLIPMRSGAASTQNRLLREAWSQLELEPCIAWHRVLLGQFESGRYLVPLARVLAEVGRLPLPVVVRRLAKLPIARVASVDELLRPVTEHDGPACLLPHPSLEVAGGGMGELGELSNWRATWLPVGIEVQVRRRMGETFAWSVPWDGSAEFDETLTACLEMLPEGTVLHGVLSAEAGATRLSVLDLWEEAGLDVRQLDFDERRRRLERMLAAIRLASRRVALANAGRGQGDLFDEPGSLLAEPSPLELVPETSLERAVAGGRWGEEARRRRARGILVFPAVSAEWRTRGGSGARLYAVQAHRFRAVLMAVQPEVARGGGSVAIGTFGVWSGRELQSIGSLPIPETELDTSMLTELTRMHSVGRFGPVRRLTPLMVFELQCDAVEASERHKAGLSMRSGRVTRRLDGVGPSEADSIDRLRSWVVSGEPGRIT